MTLQLSSVKKCCSGTPVVERIYDCGPDGEEKLLVCSRHAADPDFTEFVISEKKIGAGRYEV